MYARVALLCALMLSVAIVCGADPPAPPEPLAGVQMLDVLGAPEGEEVADVWRAQNAIDDEGAIIAKRSSAPAESLTVDGRPVLKLTCNFADTEIARGCWDRAVDLDLTRCTAVCFDLYVENIRAIGHANLYLRAGDGWYGAEWYPREEAEWCRVRIPIGEFTVDKPGGGWADIRTIRWSPWAGPREDCTIYIANFGLEYNPVPAAIVTPEYEDRDGKPVEGSKYVSSVAEMLDRAGCPLPVLSSQDLIPERLSELDLLIMPYASGMPEEQYAPVVDFIGDGGKVIALYAVPDPIADLLGVRQQGFRSAEPRGEFSSIRFAGAPPSGAPAVVSQNSWGLIDSDAVERTGEVAAWWHDDSGSRTDAPAIIMSDSGAWFSHVLFDEDADAKGRLLVALAEQYAPGTADFVAERRISLMGQRLQAQSWDEALTLTRAQPAFGDASQEAVDRANALRADAQAVADPFEAMSLADQAEVALAEAFALAQETAEDEFRATWCHPPQGIAGWGWPKTAEVLAGSGIEHLILNALHGASAAYPSEVVPFDRSNVEERDYLQEAVDACAEHGIRLHVWMTNFRATGHTPQDLMDQFRAEGRLATQDDGTVTTTLCPSDPRNQQIQIDAMVEAAKRPGVAGIHFDYIRYPDHRTCFCEGCRARFEEAIGHEIANWPDDALADGPVREQWLEFRRSNITRVVREVSEIVRREVPDCMISAAVFKNYPACADSVGQDWVAWAKAGYLDFVCPMNYTSSHTQFRKLTEAELEHLDGVVPCYPGIGLLEGLGPVGAIRQINISRELGTRGFVVWSVYPQYIDIYPYLGMSLLAD